MRALTAIALAVGALAGLAPLPATAQVGARARLSLAAVTPAIAADGDLGLRVTVTGAPAGSQLRVDIHDRALTRSELLRTIDGQGLRRQLGPPLVLPVTGTEVAVAVPTRDRGTDPARVPVGEGVYPVVLQLLDATGAELDRLTTHLVRLPVERIDNPLRVAVAAPVTSPPATRDDGTIEVAPAVAKRTSELSRAAAAHPAAPMTVVVPPEILDALALAPGTDADLLPRLARAAAAAPPPAAPYVALDAAAWVDARFTDGLLAEVTRGEEATRARLGAISPAVWLADEHLDVATARWLRDNGVRHIVVPDGTMAALDGRRFPVTVLQRFELTDAEGVDALIADGALAAHAGETGDPVLDAQRTLADLAVLYFDEPPAARAAVLTLAASSRVTAAYLDTLLAGIAATPTLLPSSLADAFTGAETVSANGRTDGRGEPLVRTLQPTEPDAIGSLPERFRTATDAVATLAAVAGWSNPVPMALQVRTLAGAHDGLGPDGRTRHMDAVEAAVAAELAKIEAPGRQRITLTAREGVVSFTIRNSTGYPARVRLFLEGSKLELPDEPDGVVDLELAEEITRVELDVRTLASGDSPLDVTLVTPDERVEIGQTRITVRSTAVSGVGVVLSVGAVVVLVAWWARDIARRRRAQRTVVE